MTDESARPATPIEQAAPEANEYEVWVNDDSLPPLLLIVIALEGDQTFRIIDPANANAGVLSSNHYLEIVAYLREEEFRPVGGRMTRALDTDD